MVYEVVGETSDMNTANILLVDDSPDNLRLLMGILRKQGYTIRLASDGSHALETIRAEPPDLILLDIMMPPGMDGYQVCEQVKADERTRDIPVMFISGKGEVVDKLKAFSQGGVDYITKPFYPEEVLARVETHLTLRNLQTHLKDLVAERTAELRLSEQQYRMLVEEVTDGIGIVQDDAFVFVNDALCGVLGVHPDRFSATCPAKARNTTLEGGQGGVTVLKTNNPERWIEMRQRGIRWEGKPSILVTVRDVTEQKRREDERKAERTRLRRENVRLRSAMKDRYKFGEIIGKSLVMQEVYELIAQAASSDANVVIYGESGTGKDLIARTIHDLSHRRKKPFIPVNCGSIQETLFEREFFGHRKGAFTGANSDKPGLFDAAHQGTLFLDEVGELTLTMQVKLLRAIEANGYTPVGAQTVKHADVRILAATNHNLKDLVKQGTMREDFYYRLAVIPITVPPLRERKEDMPLLLEHFLTQYSDSGTKPVLPGRVLDALSQRDWPGNIRQLQNVLQRYLTLKRLDFDDDLHETESDSSLTSRDIIGTGTGLRDALDAFEKHLILDALEHNHGHKNHSAEMLGIPPRTLRRKLEKYGIG